MNERLIVWFNDNNETTGNIELTREQRNKAMRSAVCLRSHSLQASVTNLRGNDDGTEAPHEHTMFVIAAQTSFYKTRATSSRQSPEETSSVLACETICCMSA